jgi:hypothetical protein
MKVARRWVLESKCHEGAERELIMCFLSDLLTEIRNVQKADCAKHESWLELGKREGFVSRDAEEDQIAVCTKFKQLTGRDLERLTGE